MAAAYSNPRRKLPQDLVGHRFGKLVIESFAGRSWDFGKSGGDSYWNCLCDCGKPFVVRRNSLVGGGTTSCGCWHNQYPEIKTGDRFGRLTIVEKDTERKYRWICRCDCGNTTSVIQQRLRNGTTLSCGCLARELTSQRSKTHGMSLTLVYGVWHGIVRRGQGKTKDKHYENVRICKRWRESFEAFYEDMGDRPSDKHSIDRVNNKGHYSCGSCEECIERGDPMNCRWATLAEQNSNRRDNRYINYSNKTLTIAEWCRRLGIATSTVHNRLNRGWNEIDAITTPPNQAHRSISRQKELVKTTSPTQTLQVVAESTCQT